MPQTIIDENGKETEVFTAEELEAQKQEAISKYKEENPDLSFEMSQLQDELKAKEEELKGLKDKDLNFSAMRNKVAGKEKEIEDLKKSIDDKVNAVKREVLDTVMKDHYNSVIDELCGGDKELKEKVELQYKRLGDVAGTKVEIAKKLSDAFVLASGNINSFDRSAFSTGGVGNIKPHIKKAGEKLSEDQKELGKRLGLSDKDLEGK